MMLQAKNYKLRAISRWLMMFLLVVLAGCGKQEQDPFVDPSDAENPNWAVTVENDMSTSMTAIVKVSFAQGEGSLAAFIGEECCGIGQYKSEYGLYWLYMSPASEGATDIELRFYSPELKRIFVAEELIPFHNDTQLGSVAAPYTPSWKAAQ